MANKQTKQLRKLKTSTKVVKGASTSIYDKDDRTGLVPGLTLKSFEIGRQPSRRTSPWRGCKSERKEVIYPAEYKNRIKK